MLPERKPCVIGIAVKPGVALFTRLTVKMLSPLLVAAICVISELKGAADNVNVLIAEKVVTPFDSVGRN